ncbi:pyrophosphorylase [Streptomyces hyaluromycini]|uniref:pyrophosphorylase n=1 Tax=Streptomyces hyaluromycini TaxID=1377993 RepID=UPI000B5C4387|nr:pyrophosphorylase [Streptomyces hyaluromycini]
MAVISTDAAHQEVARMMALITNEFPALIGKLNGHGRALSDPKHWDGPLAQKFRGEVWPQASKDLDKMHNSLRELQQQVQRILTAIDRAGGMH